MSVVVSLFFTPLVMAAEDAVVGLRSVAAVIADNTKWCLRLPQDGHIVFRGVVSFDEAGTGTASLLYPAPNVAGLLAAVFTHGLLVESAKKDQKDKLQASADKVLSPYKIVLDNFKFRDLMRRAVKKTSTGANARVIEDSCDSGGAMIVESVPVFSLTQDQKAIIVDNAIAIYMPDTVQVPAYRNTVRVVSTALDVADPSAFWTANDGDKLKDVSAQLVAESLDVAFRDAADGVERVGESYRTIRYREGAVEKIERAQVLSDHCGRLLIRTLRGTLMSIQASRAAAVTSAIDRCGPGTNIPN